MRPIVGRRPVMPPEKQDELARWARIGRNQAEAARYFSVPESTLGRYLRGELKFPRRKA